jgi:hypothetical protein
VNQAQYDTAKDVVLDLLGWGVQPEYLVDCGLTREIVYYVFSELNLRMPQNLDITGLIPYTPDMAVLAEHQLSVLMPPPSTSARGMQGKQSLPSKAHGHATQNAAAIPPTRTELRPILAETLQSPTTSSLHDMEQQRRQELLARKAAIASRKSKQFLASSDPSAASLLPPTGPSITNTHNRDAELTIPSETVEDFLKSIGPAAEEGIAPVDVEPQSRRRSADNMDVDEIPGLRGIPSNQVPPLVPAPAESEINQSHVGHNADPDAFSNVSEGQTHDYPPSSTDSASTAFTQMSVDTISVGSDSQSLQRRGTKRPVAADFDLDLGPRLQYNGSGGYSNGYMYSSSSAKHKATGFASVSGMRRCVIDLSDSEGEGDEDGIMRDVGNPKAHWGRRSGYSSPAPLVSSVNTPTGWMTPPVGAITPGMATAGIVGGASMSPAALVEKETEIRKMREMIAQRERDRRKKLAAVRKPNESSWAAPYICFSPGQYPALTSTAHLYPSNKRTLMPDCHCRRPFKEMGPVNS